MTAGSQPAGSADLYRTTIFADWQGKIDPAAFHDSAYDPVLAALVEHVLTSEAPIAEGLLVQRIARAHGFQRAGRVIRDRVMALAERAHLVEDEAGGGRFVWPNATARATWNRARWPATMEEARQIEDIALAELRIAKRGRTTGDVARDFGVRRISAGAGARIESA